jgi:hypothetical protein
MRPATTGILMVVLFAAIAGVPHAQPAAKDGARSRQDTLYPADPLVTHAAVLYFEELISPFTDVRKASYTYMQTVVKMRKARTVEKSRQELLQVVQSKKEICKGSTPFEGDSTLKCELIRYLDLVDIILKEDFAKILDMEDIAAQSYDQEEAHQLALDLAVEKLRASFDVFKKAQKDFFIKYHINEKKEQDELTQKIEKANRAIEYYKAVSRIFLKTNKENYYAGEAVSSKDIAALGQHATTLVSFAEEGLEKLKQKGGYEGDDKLLSSAVTMLEFYRHEGQTTYPVNVDFYLKTENMEKAQKRLNSIKESDRKKEDIDQFNREVKAYNEAVKEVNKANKASYKTHKKLLKSWNKQMEKFFKNHS